MKSADHTFRRHTDVIVLMHRSCKTLTTLWTQAAQPVMHDISNLTCNKVPINGREAQPHDGANCRHRAHSTLFFFLATTSLGGCSTECASHLQHQQQLRCVFCVNLTHGYGNAAPSVPVMDWHGAPPFNMSKSLSPSNSMKLTVIVRSPVLANKLTAARS